MKPTIYTIGYQRLAPSRLLHIAQQLDALVVDCRFKPVSRKPSFGGRQLSFLLGDRYTWKGNVLGGRLGGGQSHTTPKGIQWIKDQKRNLILLCLEEAPGDCHRHHDICGPHFPDALHIFEDELFTANDLNSALAGDCDCDSSGLLADILEAA
jgi:hypothetical protein